MSDEEDDEYFPCKVVLLGEAGVGKTSIIQRYVANSFTNVLMSTTGASFATKKVKIDDEHKIKFEIWDTAGQEKFRSIAKIFYQSAAAAILVYDITRRDSFDNIKNFWQNELKENASKDIIIALAGNKSDNYENEKVPTDEGKALAKDLNAIFKTTSARLAQGIDELFKLIGQKFINPNFNVGSSTMTKEEEMEYRRRLEEEKMKKESTKLKKDTKDKKKGCC